MHLQTGMTLALTVHNLPKFNGFFHYSGPTFQSNFVKFLCNILRYEGLGLEGVLFGQVQYDMKQGAIALMCKMSRPYLFGYIVIKNM